MLQALADLLNQAMIDKGIEPERAGLIARITVNRFQHEHQGNTLYVPMPKRVSRETLLLEFDGCNYLALAKKHKVTCRYVRNLLR